MAGRAGEGEQGGEGKQKSRPTGGPETHTKNLDPGVKDPIILEKWNDPEGKEDSLPQNRRLIGREMKGERTAAGEAVTLEPSFIQ